MHWGADEGVNAGELLPARMLNEFAYCPRLFYLEFVQGEFVDTHFTIDGQDAHRRVNVGTGKIPAPACEESFEVRSVSPSSATLALSAKIDLVEGDEGWVTPV